MGGHPPTPPVSSSRGQSSGPMSPVSAQVRLKEFAVVERAVEQRPKHVLRHARERLEKVENLQEVLRGRSAQSGRDLAPGPLGRLPPGTESPRLLPLCPGSWHRGPALPCVIWRARTVKPVELCYNGGGWLKGWRWSPGRGRRAQRDRGGGPER